LVVKKGIKFWPILEDPLACCALVLACCWYDPGWAIAQLCLLVTFVMHLVAYCHLSVGRKPWRLRSDKGNEFINRDFQQLLKKESISFFTSQ